MKYNMPSPSLRIILSLDMHFTANIMPLNEFIVRPAQMSELLLEIIRTIHQCLYLWFY